MHARYRLLAGFIAVAASLTLAANASAMTYDILIENLIPGGMATGNPLTPPVAVVHDNSYSLFMDGGKATPGLTLQAEEGNPADLVAEANASSGVSSVTVGDGPFLGMVMMSVEAEPGDLLSISTMLARSNDLITGIHDVVLPAMGSMMMMTNAYDAGTEENTGLVADIPFYGNNFVGPDEANPISMINAYTVFDDPDAGQIDYEFPPVARITVTAHPSTPTEAASWSEVKSRYAD